MDSITRKELPEWLTPAAISKLRADIEKCDEPYTEKDVENIELDGKYDTNRYAAFEAIQILSEFGLYL